MNTVRFPALFSAFLSVLCASAVHVSAARPDLVTIEPKRRDILSAIKTLHEIPGLRIFEDSEVSAR